MTRIREEEDCSCREKQKECSNKEDNRVATYLENLEMSGNLTAVRDSTENQGNVREKILSGKSCLKLFIVNCLFVSIQVFGRSLFCVKY